jgi:glycosyltransferase involved in cell wall biosynthesis
LSEFKNYKDFWNLVDVLFVPSRADNSPNVIHEAKLWGVPVLTSDVGGIPEILDKSFDSSISLDSASTDFIESEIRRIYLISKDFDLKKDIALRHKMRLSASIKMHIDFYKSIA